MSGPTRAELQADNERLRAQLDALTAAQPLSATLSAPRPVQVLAPWASVNKALAGGLAATVAFLGGALADGDLTSAELVAALGAGLVAAGAVYRTKNADTPAPEAPASDEEVEQA